MNRIHTGKHDQKYGAVCQRFGAVNILPQTHYACTEFICILGIFFCGDFERFLYNTQNIQNGNGIR